MKWGKALNAKVEETPEWSPYFLNFKSMKKELKAVKEMNSRGVDFKGRNGSSCLPCCSLLILILSNSNVVGCAWTALVRSSRVGLVWESYFEMERIFLCAQNETWICTD
mmetsp:Transcript_21166/g.86434  ORF Transcript_21166/g.86434 Transcript_21166/m.86434 type:complete len:109 (-) Transcript_21166:3380-3706(-)